MLYINSLELIIRKTLSNMRILWERDEVRKAYLK